MKVARVNVSDAPQLVTVEEGQLGGDLSKYAGMYVRLISRDIAAESLAKDIIKAGAIAVKIVVEKKEHIHVIKPLQSQGQPMRKGIESLLPNTLDSKVVEYISEVMTRAGI